MIERFLHHWQDRWAEYFQIELKGHSHTRYKWVCILSEGTSGMFCRQLQYNDVCISIYQTTWCYCWTLRISPRFSYLFPCISAALQVITVLAVIQMLTWLEDVWNWGRIVVMLLKNIRKQGLRSKMARINYVKP